MSDTQKLKRIILNFSNNRSRKEELCESVLNLLDFVKNPTIRVKCLDLLYQVGLKSQKVYKILENSMISDESNSVRVQAIKSMYRLFPEQSLMPISWLIKHDESFSVMRNIIKFFEERNTYHANLIKKTINNRLESEYQVIAKNARFLLDLDCQLNKNGQTLVFGLKSKENQIISLNLAGLKLKNIPKSVGNLTKLRYLNLWNNNLKNLPWTMTFLKDLDSLYLNYNNFKKLPDFWNEFVSLKKLSLSNNFSLNSIPTSLLTLVKRNFSKKYQEEGVNQSEAYVLGLLEVLTGQRLRKLENSESRSKVCAINYTIKSNGNIKGIYIYGYYGFQINFIPNQLRYLRRLQEIIIRDQNIKEIPIFIAKMKTLELLDLMGNNIKNVPSWLFDHESLQKLDLSENSLTLNKSLINNCKIVIWT